MTESILIGVIALHLLTVNLAGAGPLLAAWIDWLGARRNRSDLQQSALRLVRWSMLAAVVGVGMGAAAWWQLAEWPPHRQESFSQMLRDSISAERWRYIVAEIAFYFVCLLICSALWRRIVHRSANRWIGRILAIAAATNLLYHFPALFTVLAIKFEQNDWSHIDHHRYLQLLGTSLALARVFHVVLASFAVAGLALGWIGLISRPKASVDLQESLKADTKQRNPATVSALGGRVSLGSTLLQIPIGIWMVLAMPDSQAEHVLTGNPLFIFAVVFALGLMHQFAMLALGDVSRRRLSVSTMMLVLVVLLMTAALELSRTA